MIKAVIEDVLILGLSDKNVEGIRKDMPMYIDLVQMGSPQLLTGIKKIAIIHGADELDIVNKLSSLIGPQTKITAEEISNGDQETGEPH